MAKRRKKATDFLREDSVLRKERQIGLKALLKRDRAYVEDPSGVVNTSLDIDSALKEAEPNASRWDYLLEVRHEGSPIVGVEIHPAVPREVKKLIEKKQWARKVEAEHFNDGHFICAWYWLASGKMGLSKNSREYRLLAQNGIKIQERLRLLEDLGD